MSIGIISNLNLKFPYFSPELHFTFYCSYYCTCCILPYQVRFHLNLSPCQPPRSQLHGNRLQPQQTNQPSSSTTEATPTWLWSFHRRRNRGRGRIGWQTRGVVVILRVSYINLLFSLFSSHWCPVALNWAQRRSCPSTTNSLYNWLTSDQFPLDQLIDSIDWPILSRDATQPVRWTKLGTVTNVYNPNETNNAVERMSRTLKNTQKKKKKRRTNLWRVLISKWWNFSLTFYVTWGNVIFFNHCMWLFWFAMKLLEWMVHLWRQCNVETPMLEINVGVL